jgi:GNAT superfamily N-acetyltransferase
LRPISPRAEAEVRPLRRDDEAAFVTLGQEDASVFRGRLEAGHQGWGAWCSGALRYVSWVAFRETEVEYLSCRLMLADDVGYVYRAFADPPYRRLGLGPATQAACMEMLRRQGFRLVLAAVLPDNPWAFPPWLRVGYRRIGVVRTLGTGLRRRVFVSLDRESGAPAGWKFERFRRGEPLKVDGRS